MEELLALSLLCFHPVAWIAMGRGWGAAFKAPFAVLLPGVALIVAHATMFEGFQNLPPIFSAILVFEVFFLFAVACLWAASAAMTWEVKGGVKGKGKARVVPTTDRRRTSYLLRHDKTAVAPLRPVARNGRVNLARR